MIPKKRTEVFFRPAPLVAMGLLLGVLHSMAGHATTSIGAGNADIALPFGLGYEFTVASNHEVTALGQFDVKGDGAVPTAKVALYNWDTGAKLVETTLAEATLEETGHYDTYFVSLTTPIKLLANVRYLVATEVIGNDFAYGNNIMTFDPAIRWLEGRATNVGSPAQLPATATATSFAIQRTNEPNGAYFGPNLKLTPSPAGTAAVSITSINQTNTNYSTGWRFSTSGEIRVTHLGKFDINGGGLSGGPAEVALYNASTGARVATATVPATSTPEPNGTVNAYYAPISPIVLSPGQYIIAAAGLTEPFSFASTAAFASGITWLDGKATGQTQPLPPTTAGFTITRTEQGCYFGGTFKFEPVSPPGASSITISSPASRHLVQRSASNTGSIPLAGSYTGSPSHIEARAVVMAGAGHSGTTTDWQSIASSPAGGTFSGTLTNVPAGGWYQLEVRSVVDRTPSTATVLQKVGVGDIYVTGGQSNSANYGTGGYTASDDRVCARTSVTGSNWILAADPIPLAGGSGGSVWPCLGDLLAAAENIPIGFIAVGVGSTEVSQWIPGSSYYNTLLKPSFQSFPSGGFRAMLWHQGESDSIASTSATTYQSRLHAIIAQSRTDSGWHIPWYIAEAAFHPYTALSAEEPVAAGQRATVHHDPLVFLGPSTDEFHLEDANGGKLADTVHFNRAGLLGHAQQWRDILRGTTSLTPRNGNFEENRSPSITGLAPLSDGAAHLVTTTGNNDSPSVLGWRILAASGTTAASGTNGFHNPGSGSYAAATDSNNGGVLPNMNGKHAAILSNGSAGNHFLHSTRVLANPKTHYILTVAIGVRDNPASFGNARLEITASGTVVASKTFTKAMLDTLRGGAAAGTFTDASVTWTTGSTVAPNQPLAIRIAKEGGTGTLLDFDNVRLTSSPVPSYQSWIRDPAFGIDPAAQDFAQDPDGDGLPNGIESWFGTHPGQQNPGPTNLQTVSTTTTFAHPQNANPPSNIIGHYEWSPNLADWYVGDGVQGPPRGPTLTISYATLGTTIVTATASQALDHLFLRVRVVPVP